MRIVLVLRKMEFLHERTNIRCDCESSQEHFLKRQDYISAFTSHLTHYRASGRVGLGWAPLKSRDIIFLFLSFLLALLYSVTGSSYAPVEGGTPDFTPTGPRQRSSLRAITGIAPVSHQLNTT